MKLVSTCNPIDFFDYIIFIIGIFVILLILGTACYQVLIDPKSRKKSKVEIEKYKTDKVDNYKYYDKYEKRRGIDGLTLGTRFFSIIFIIIIYIIYESIFGN